MWGHYGFLLQIRLNIFEMPSYNVLLLHVSFPYVHVLSLFLHEECPDILLYVRNPEVEVLHPETRKPEKRLISQLFTFSKALHLTTSISTHSGYPISLQLSELHLVNTFRLDGTHGFWSLEATEIPSIAMEF